MAGIYIHIPFCTQRCSYCDFFSSTCQDSIEDYLQALCQEIDQREELRRTGQTFDTIYIGGGTPSCLSVKQLSRIFEALATVVCVPHCQEVTLEMNPDDVTPAYIEALRSLPVNRISMGVQTFQPEGLRLMRRRHTAQQAVEAFELCRQAGYGNISLDLIYGWPGQSLTMWQDDLRQMTSLRPEHISAYHLSYEVGTPLHRMLTTGRVKEVSEAHSLQLFKTLRRLLTESRYTQYELSNFALPGRRAKHNAAYWQGVPYVGLGAGAHSFDPPRRCENIPHLQRYISGVTAGKDYQQEEIIETEEAYNELVMVRLRTCEGICLKQIDEQFPEHLKRHFAQTAHTLQARGLVERTDTHLRLSEEGLFLSDAVIRDLFYV